jgi:hypothetical protein
MRAIGILRLRGNLLNVIISNYRLVVRLSTQKELGAEVLRAKVGSEGISSAVSVCNAVTGGFHEQVAV